MEMTKVEFDRIRRHVRKRSGLCTHCGKEDAYTMVGRSLCFECSEKRRNYLSICRKDQFFCERKNESAKSLREKRKRLGLCPSCGRPVKDEFVTCKFCRARSRRYNAAYRLKLRLIAEE